MSAFDTHQTLQCLFCSATTNAVPSTLLGNRYRKRSWYSNGLLDKGIIFALCPEHQTQECHDRAWDWAKAQANPRPILQEEINALFA